MALAWIRPKLAENRNGSNGSRRSHPRHDDTLDGLTAAALYDLQLHGLAPLTGAALDVRAKNAMDVRRLIQPWQARSMSYYDLVPEVKFAAQFMAQMLRKVRLYPAMLDTETHEPEELHDGPVFDAFQRIQDRSGGHEELQGSYGKLRFLIGECYLTVSPDMERGEVWECLSPNELRVQPGGLATRFRAPMLSADQYLIGDMAPEQYVIGNDKATIAKHGSLEPQFDAPITGPEFRDHGPDVIVVYRLWRPHPAYSWLADCNMQASTDILEELVLSTYSVRAQLKSRLNQGGLLPIPDEISFTSLGNNPEEDPNSDIFQDRLTQAIMAAIGDPGTAAAFSPIVVRMAGEFVDKIKLVKFNDTAGELAEINQRAEMVERFGVGAELPPELFRNKEDMNHWNAWLIDEETWKSYGAPAALEMANDLNAAYLQPTLMEDFADWANVRIGVDPAAVINHPDRAKDADALYAGRAISKKVWRESKGYNDNDAMPDDELNESLGVAIRDGSLAKYGIPSVRANIEPTAGEVESAQGDVSAPVAPGAVGADIEKGAPQSGPRATEGEAGPAITASGSGITRDGLVMGACGYAVRRARTMAGSRLRAMTRQGGPKKMRCEECERLIDGIANWSVASTLGQERVVELVQLSGAVTNLVDGAGQELAAELEAIGVSPVWATELGELVEQHAAKTLYDAEPPPLPAAFAALLRRIDTPLERT